VKLLTIIGSANLNEVIEAALNVEANQKVKAKKRNQAYMVDTIEKLRQEVHNLQVIQSKSWQNKSSTLAKPLQGT